MRVPVDMVELESRLAAIERRLAHYESREQRLLELIAAVQRLTEVVGPLIKETRPPAPEVGERRAPHWPRIGTGPPTAGPVAPERIALAHARLRETLFAGTTVEPEGPPASGSEVARASGPRVASPGEPGARAAVRGAPALVPPPRSKSWVLRALRHMVKRDPHAAGGLVRALLPAHDLAQLPPIGELPGPPDALARVLVAGRIRRRIRWEKERLACAPKTVSELVPLVRLRASPAQLRAAGVGLEPGLAFSVVAFSVEPAWTGGHRFTIAHRGPDLVTYFTVLDRTRPVVGTEPPPAPVTTTICCLDEALFPVLCGELPPGVTVLGALAPLQLVQRWFARATSG
jgi:hypothetical protein